MSSALSSRDRLVAAIRREPVDYVPCSVRFNPLTEVQRRGWSWNFPWPEEAGLEEQLRFQVEGMGLDQVVDVGVAVTRQAEGVCSEVRLEGDVLHKVQRTPAGELHAAVRYNDLWPHGPDIPLFSDFNVGHFVEPWIQSREDLECFKQLFIPRDPDESLAEAQACTAPRFDLARRWGLATMASAGMGLTGAQHLFGVRELCMAAIEDPDLVDDYLEFEHARNLAAIAVLGRLGVDIISRNGFYETADFYGPAMLGRFLSRRLNAEAAAARRAGMVTSYTVHTGVMPILDHLGALGLDSLFGIDVGFGGVDMGVLRERLSPSKALWTGPSSTYHIWKGAEATREAVREVMDCFGPRGLILSPCVSCHSIMPWESAEAMVDEWKRLREGGGVC